MRRKPRPGVTSEVRSSVTPAVPGRQWRDRLTRVVTSPIKGKETHAKQWSRWTP